MIFEQLYLGCLAQASYLVGSRGEAAVVDPRRDVEDYLALAQERGLSIRYVIETHLHADFVSGHRELAARTGATIVISREANAAFSHLAVVDGEVLPLGELTLRFLATPGHTPESMCVVLEEGGRPVKVLTGDTLFVGDVGRPDLAGGAGFTPQEMAEALYDSLHGKLLTLPDEVEVWPGHGAGSLCGKNMSTETSSTIGMQRRLNYALQPMARSAFVTMMTRDRVEAPRYFARDALINRRGAGRLADVRPPQSLSPSEVVAALEGEATLLDVRTTAAYGAAHIPQSLHIGLHGQFASWAGTLIVPETNLLILASSREEVEEATMRLARVGLENARGVVSGGIEAWQAAGRGVSSIAQISVQDLYERMDADGRLQLVDVRRAAEYRDGHAAGAISIPLHVLADGAPPLRPDCPVAVLCASGYRSSIATSILERLGWRELYNVTGGTAAWLAAGLPAEGPGLPQGIRSIEASRDEGTTLGARARRAES